MTNRTSRFAILAMSLATLFDVHQPQDLMRGLLNTLTEYEQSKEDKYNDSRPAKMVTLLRHYLELKTDHKIILPANFPTAKTSSGHVRLFIRNAHPRHIRNILSHDTTHRKYPDPRN